MIKSLFKHSLRALRRQKTYVLINVLGLAIGIACSLIIALFIIHELSFDQYHEKKDRLYRVILNGKMGGQELQVTSTAAPIGPTMLNEFPEVEDFLRINGRWELVIKYEDKHFIEKYNIEADSSFFNFFSIPLIKGNTTTVLNEKHTAVLSETLAAKIFGEEDPVNKMIKVGNDETLFRVTGVMQDIPENTHFRANMITSFMTNSRSADDQWLSNSFDTYALLHPNSNPQDVDARFVDMIVKYVGPLVTKYFGTTLEDFLSQGNKYRLFLQPLGEIHLNPNIEQDLRPASDPKYLWIFGSIAMLIIVIAGINFMNLSTAQASKRAKEVGIKMVSGSTKRNLVSQFLLETIILSFIALLLAVLATELFLPNFNDLLGTELVIGYFNNWFTIPALLLFSILIGIFAGSYPSFYLSSFNPVYVLKGSRSGSKSNTRLRSVLVILQFSISIILIVGTMIMFRQISFMQSKKLGFDKEHVFVISRGGTISDNIQSFKNEIRQMPDVVNITTSTAIPGHNNNNNGYMMKGREEESFLLMTSWADQDFLKVYGMEMAEGRFFDKTFGTEENAVVVNETAVKHYNMADPLSEKFMDRDDETMEVSYMPIVGVVKDFHHESLQREIGPFMFRYREDFSWGYISIRLAPTASSETVEKIESLWGSYTDGQPMQYFFLDEDFERLYKEEKQNARLSILFTILGILIASLGLYGLTAFTVQQRTKEIGIRKVFGASVSRVWYLISREIMILIAISTLIAWPLVYWIADTWLQNYHYRISLDAFDFILGFLVAMIIALLTTTYRTVRTARLNPVDSLRYE